MARVSTFFDLVKTQFDSSTFEKIQTLWKQAHEYKKCSVLIKSGKREGEICGKGCVDGQETCLCHIPRQVSEAKSLCSFVLVSGKNKGNSCKRECVGELCSNHKNKKEKETVPEKVKKEKVKKEQVVEEEQVDEQGTCQVILKSGQKKGSVCGKKCITGFETCATHKTKA